MRKTALTRRYVSENRDLCTAPGDEKKIGGIVHLRLEKQFSSMMPYQILTMLDPSAALLASYLPILQAN
jgi:hypothetical protein